MTIKKTIKTSLLIIAILILITLMYSCIPRVGYNSSAYGTNLEKSNSIPIELEKQLKEYIKDSANNAQAVVIMQNEKILLEAGKTKKLINCHSARKSIMSLLIGIAKDKGLLSLDETLGELGIDESKTPLTEQEKTATIKDLLMSKSGVYLQAEAETDFAKNNRPEREQYKPGEFFFYNNFDFNVLGTILEQKTGMSIGEFMEEHLAKPLGMQDFRAKNVIYGNPWPVRDDSSDHRVYWMFLSARDLARIGVVVAQNGIWNDTQIVSSKWLQESLQPHTDKLDKSMQPFDAYSYLWWLDRDNQTIWADGYGGQFLLIDPGLKLVISQRNFTGNSLLSSGLFLMKKNKDGYRSDVMHIHNVIKEELNQKKTALTHTKKEQKNKNGDKVDAKHNENIPDNLRYSNDSIEKMLLENKVPAMGVGIIEQGKLTKVRVYGTLDKKMNAPANTIFKVASLTKPVFALTVLKLIDNGDLGLDEPLYTYWIDPEIENDERHKLLTPRLLLSHQSGLPNWRYLNDTKKLSFEFHPGNKYGYSGEGYEYLRKAIENKLGKDIEQLAREMVFEAANMTDTRFWWDKTMDVSRYAQNFDRNGQLIKTEKYYEANAAANLLTTVRDYGNFLTYVLNKADLSDKLYNEMVKHPNKIENKNFFGLGWGIQTGFSTGEYVLAHSGRDPGVNTLAVVFPETKNGYLIFLNSDNAFKIFEKMLSENLYLGKELWNMK